MGYLNETSVHRSMVQVKKPKLAMWIKWHEPTTWWVPPWLWGWAVRRVDHYHEKKDDEARAYIRETQPKIAEGFRSLAEQRAKLAELREKNDMVGE